MYTVVKGNHTTIYLHSCVFQKAQIYGLVQFWALTFLQLLGGDSMCMKMIQFPVYG